MSDLQRAQHPPTPPPPPPPKRGEPAGLPPHPSPHTHLAAGFGHPGQPQAIGQHGRRHRGAVVAPPAHQHQPQAGDVPRRAEGEARGAGPDLRQRRGGGGREGGTQRGSPAMPSEGVPASPTLVTPPSLQTCAVLYVYCASMKSLPYATSGLSTTKGSAIVPAAGMEGNATPAAGTWRGTTGPTPSPGHRQAGGGTGYAGGSGGAARSPLPRGQRALRGTRGRHESGRRGDADRGADIAGGDRRIRGVPPPPASPSLTWSRAAAGAAPRGCERGRGSPSAPALKRFPAPAPPGPAQPKTFHRRRIPPRSPRPHVPRYRGFEKGHRTRLRTGTPRSAPARCVLSLAPPAPCSHRRSERTGRAGSPPGGKAAVDPGRGSGTGAGGSRRCLPPIHCPAPAASGAAGGPGAFPRCRSHGATAPGHREPELPPPVPPRGPRLGHPGAPRGHPAAPYRSVPVTDGRAAGRRGGPGSRFNGKNPCQSIPRSGATPRGPPALRPPPPALPARREDSSTAAHPPPRAAAPRGRAGMGTTGSSGQSARGAAASGLRDVGRGGNTAGTGGHLREREMRAAPKAPSRPRASEEQCSLRGQNEPRVGIPAPQQIIETKITFLCTIIHRAGRVRAALPGAENWYFSTAFLLLFFSLLPPSHNSHHCSFPPLPRRAVPSHRGLRAQRLRSQLGAGGDPTLRSHGDRHGPAAMAPRPPSHDPPARAPVPFRALWDAVLAVLSRRVSFPPCAMLPSAPLCRPHPRPRVLLL